ELRSLAVLWDLLPKLPARSSRNRNALRPIQEASNISLSVREWRQCATVCNCPHPEERIRRFAALSASGPLLYLTTPSPPRLFPFHRILSACAAPRVQEL